MSLPQAAFRTGAAALILLHACHVFTFLLNAHNAIIHLCCFVLFIHLMFSEVSCRCAIFHLWCSFLYFLFVSLFYLLCYNALLFLQAHFSWKRQLPGGARHPRQGRGAGLRGGPGAPARAARRLPAAEKLIPAPQLLPPGYSSVSYVFPRFPAAGGDPEVGGGDNFLGLLGFILENVPNLLNFNGGGDLAVLVEALREAGYIML